MPIAYSVPSKLIIVTRKISRASAPHMEYTGLEREKRKEWYEFNSVTPSAAVHPSATLHVINW